MNWAKIQDTLCDLELVLKDDSYEITLNIHKVILSASCPYFDHLLSFKDISTLTLTIPNAIIARDLLKSFYHQPLPFTDWLYQLQMIKNRDYFGLDVSMPDIKVPESGFELFLEMCEIVGFDNAVIKLINNNLPQDYDLSKLSPDLILEMINVGSDYRIISGNYNHRINFWNDTKVTGRYHCSSLKCLALTHDNTRIIIGNDRGNIKIFDIEKKLVINDLNGHRGSVNCIAISSDDEYIVSASTDKSIKIWNLEKYSFVKTLKGHDTAVSNIVLSSDYSRIISTSNVCIKIWNFFIAEVIHDIKIIFHDRSVVITSDDKYFLTATCDDHIIVWDLEAGLKLKSLYNGSGMHNISLTWDDKYIVCRYDGNKIKIWDIESGLLVCILEGSDSYLSCLTTTKTQIISGGSDGKIFFWDLETRSLVKTLESNDNNRVDVILPLLHENALVKRLKNFLD